MKIILRTPSGKPWKEVDAELVGALAIHRGTEPGEKRLWYLTHVPTGCLLRAEGWPSREDAALVAQRLTATETGIDWNFDLVDEKKLKTAHRIFLEVLG